MATCGERIKALRKESEESQKTFSATIGISQAHLSNIEKGKDNPSDKLLRTIAAEYEVRFEWLKSGVGEKHLDAPVADAQKILSQLRKYFSECDDLEYSIVSDYIRKLPQFLSHENRTRSVEVELILEQDTLMDAIFQLNTYLDAETYKIQNCPDIKEKIDELFAIKDIYKNKINTSIEFLFNIYIGTGN